MTIGVARFRKAYPEFKEASAVLVQQKIDAAELRTSRTNWGTLADEAVMLLAAHLLASSPTGEKLRLAKDDSTTIYFVDLQALRKAAMVGLGRLS